MIAVTHPLCHVWTSCLFVACRQNKLLLIQPDARGTLFFFSFEQNGSGVKTHSLKNCVFSKESDEFIELLHCVVVFRVAKSPGFHILLR